MPQYPSTLETGIASSLHDSFSRTSPDSDFQEQLSSDFLSYLEHYIPSLLSEKYPEIEGGLLDGFYITSARKLDPCSAEIYGWAILLSVPGVTPFYFRIKLNDAHDSVDSYDLFFGEAGHGRLGIARTLGAGHLIETRPAPIHQIQWKYTSSRKNI